MTEWRWRDGKGLVHVLVARDAYYINSYGTVQHWSPLCGYARKSDKRSQSAMPVTCLACMVKDFP